MLSLAGIPWSLARRDPDRVVISVDSEHLTALELDRAASGVAALLNRRGLRAGGRVAVLCGNGLAFPIAHFGVLRTGAVNAPLSTASAGVELRDALRRLRPAAVVADAEHEGPASDAVSAARSGATLVVLDERSTRSSARRAALATLIGHASTDPVPVGGAWPAVVLGTSGTTGMPKRAVHSHVGLLLNARAVADDMLGLREDDVQLGALPLAHSFGLSAVLHASLLAGASVALMRRFEPDVAVKVMRERAVTVVQGVPTALARLAAAAPAAGMPGVRRIVVSGAPLPAGLAADVHSRLSGDVVERWGLTEASPLTMRSVPADGGEPGLVGRPLRGVVVRVARPPRAEGELEAAAPTMFLGYLGDPRGTAAAVRNGFLRTGDSGTVDRDGTVRLRGRIKDVIVRGGNNVAAIEVERVLESHPAVAEASVVGLPDAELGEEVAAVVVLRARGSAGPDELTAYCRERLASYKVPRQWAFERSLPRTSTGKVRKRELGAWFG